MPLPIKPEIETSLKSAVHQAIKLLVLSLSYTAVFCTPRTIS